MTFEEKLEILLAIAKERKPPGYTDVYSDWLRQAAKVIG